MDTATQVQNLDEVIGISQNANALGDCSHSCYRQIVGQTDSLNLLRQPVFEKENQLNST